jgi:hypothetical protein
MCGNNDSSEATAMIAQQNNIIFMVLCSTFKANWKNQFPVDETRVGTFFNEGYHEVQVSANFC